MPTANTPQSRPFGCLMNELKLVYVAFWRLQSFVH